MSGNLKILVTFVCLALGLLMGCKEKTPDVADTAGGGVQSVSITIHKAVSPSILLEAESGKIEEPMGIFSDDAEASGGAYVLAPEGPEHKEISVGGGVTLKFDAPEAGEYSLWLRTKWCCDCGNTVNVVLDGIELGTVGDATLEAWHWTPLQKRVDLSAGPHVLVILNREDGAQVDQVLMAQDADYRPAGIEAASVPGRHSPSPEISAVGADTDAADAQQGTDVTAQP